MSGPKKTGARGLRSIIEKDLESLQFALPSLAKSGVKSIMVLGNGEVVYQYRQMKKKVSV